MTSSTEHAQVLPRPPNPSVRRTSTRYQLRSALPAHLFWSARDDGTPSTSRTARWSRRQLRGNRVNKSKHSSHTAVRMSDPRPPLSVHDRRVVPCHPRHTRARGDGDHRRIRNLRDPEVYGTLWEKSAHRFKHRHCPLKSAVVQGREDPAQRGQRVAWTTPWSMDRGRSPEARGLLRCRRACVRRAWGTEASDPPISHPSAYPDSDPASDCQCLGRPCHPAISRTSVRGREDEDARYEQ